MARLLIADDSNAVRESLRTTLTKHDEWVVCGEASNGQKDVLLAAELRPDLIILDFGMPMLNGIGAAADIANILPSTPVVLYTMHKNPQLDRAAQEAGICRVISKSEPFDSLISAIEDLLAHPASVESRAIANTTGSTLDAAIGAVMPDSGTAIAQKSKSALQDC